MAFQGKVSKNVELLKGLQLALAQAKTARVKVGILAGNKVDRKAVKKPGDPIDNPTLGLVHEFGSVKRKIPPRSFLRMPLNSQLRKKIAEIGEAAWRSLIEKKGLLQALKELGVIAENTIQEAFNTGGFGQWQQWSAGYARRKEISFRRKKGKIKAIGPFKPGSLLIASAQLRKSVTSQVVQGDA